MENSPLKYLAFVKTVETGSFTRAAQELDYAQSSISKMVSDLETEWGMTLMERSKKGVCLTSAGEQILPFLRKGLQDHQKLEGQICRMNGLETGVVRIATFASVAINWLPNLFAALQRDYPGIEYEMLLGDYEEVEHWIDEGRVDCGFLRLPTLPKFDTILLKQDEYKVVLPSDHALAKKRDSRSRGLERSAVFIAGARWKNRGFRSAGAVPCAARYPLYHMGGFCHHGDGGKGHGRQHSAGYDSAAYPLSN